MFQSRQAEEKIRALLTFPCGWLKEEVEAEDTMDNSEVREEQVDRMEQMPALRSFLPPHRVTVLHGKGQNSKCVPG